MKKHPLTSILVAVAVLLLLAVLLCRCLSMPILSVPRWKRNSLLPWAAR